MEISNANSTCFLTATSLREEEAHEILSPTPNESPACVQPPALEKRSVRAVKASSLPRELVDQVSRTGGVEFLKALRETLT